jgi:very-short-patch-repair endonuclease
MSGTFQHILEPLTQSRLLDKALKSSSDVENAKAHGVLAAARRGGKQAADVEAIWPKCESPIETALAAALCYAPWPCEVEIQPQVPIGTYRLDFMVIGSGHRIDVECDGKEFHHHDITMEKWRADRARDAFVESEGVSVIRFRGTDIWVDAIGCAEEVAALLANLIAGGE